MELAVFFPLLLLVCSASTGSVTKNADYKPPYEPLPYDIHAVLSDMKAEIGQLQKRNEGGQVAFSASLYTKHRRHFGPFKKRTPLVYKYVVTNIGHAYDSNTGIFTAPLRGAYHFEFHVGAHGDKRRAAGVLLYKNEHHVFSAYEQQTAHYGSASNSVSLILEKGDKVSIRMFANRRVYDDHNHYCTFSGHLMFTM
ncbi:complement C1q-like protein 2 [Scomber scombrus]|uniref:Complement C1q-like protein 2 n=1 Tax=Scomber scombrus TaxID=13677 RepID=A0AAV1QKT6_SCOSC